MAAVSTAFCFVGIMMLLSLVGKTEQATGGAAWGALTVMAMFGGGMIPIAFMPSFMANISNYDPVKWAVLSVEGAGLERLFVSGNADALRDSGRSWSGLAGNGLIGDQQA